MWGELSLPSCSSCEGGVPETEEDEDEDEDREIDDQNFVRSIIRTHLAATTHRFPLGPAILGLMLSVAFLLGSLIAFTANHMLCRDTCRGILFTLITDIGAAASSWVYVLTFASRISRRKK